MSEPIRVALVAEGPTDFVVLTAAIASMLGGREFVPQLLQPEFSEAFQPLTGGWSGVYHWCHQTASEGGGSVQGSALFGAHDVLVIHLDADVAGKTYASGRIVDDGGDLPCEKPCPPASATTEALHKVIARWLGASDLPPRCVLCTPSKSTEAWVMYALFPHSKVMAKAGWECYPDPEAQLGQQTKKHRIRKNRKDYETKKTESARRWPALCEKLPEAARFTQRFVGQLPSEPPS